MLRWPLKRPPMAPLTLRMPGNRMSAQGASFIENTSKYRTRRVPVSNPPMSKEKDSRDWLRLVLNFVAEVGFAVLVFVIAVTSFHPVWPPLF